ncbi:hypothetical protein PAI11_10470 [Patulibacter medicamentivorans]|uniref:Uncharacterized protein n=1 Tax=Patulibacter medicamentivorans TaxID=1097667 RepID=H0E2N4_9ACTN|nr:hypothetical protein [Patulibacter medicamentivorans]EHN12048.1 hypothetical protein PAI11_10470 [Patulibacter medicamentivorans]
MSDFIEGLEHDLVRAAARRAGVPEPAAAGPLRALGERAGRWSLRTVLVAIVLSFGVTAGAAAATLLALRGSVIPAPAKEDVPPTQTPVPASSHVSSLRVADPDAGVPPWTLRIARSETGYTCSTVGQVRDGRFGLVGMDGRFRTMAEGVTDACGEEQRGARATLVGARVLAARRPRDVRTVVSGVAGGRLRRVEVASVGGRRRLPVAGGGAFLAVYAGYPENLGLVVTMTFAGGHRQVERLGADSRVVLDPSGGNAWTSDGSGTTSGDARTCTDFTWARQQADAPLSPRACGLLRQGGKAEKYRQFGFFFAVRRLSAAERPIGRGPGSNRRRWPRGLVRTAVWGVAGHDVRSVSVLGAPGGPRRALQRYGGIILAVLPASVPPRQLRIRLRMRDGSVRTFRGDANLVRRPVPAPRPGAGR